MLKSQTFAPTKGIPVGKYVGRCDSVGRYVLDGADVEGREVGSEVLGAAEGLRLGDREDVGLTEGAIDGSSVGVRVGVREGKAVGTELVVGENEGMAVGSFV